MKKRSLNPRLERRHKTGLLLTASPLVLLAVLTACTNDEKAKGGTAEPGEVKRGRFGLTEEQAKSPLLKIGDRVLTLESAAVLLGPPPKRRGGPTEAERRAQFVDDQLQLELLDVEARRQGIYDRPAIQKLTENTLVAQFVADLSTPAPEVTEAEARVYYEKHPERFTVPARSRSYHVLVKDERKATTLLKALGPEPTLEEFMAVARRESDDAYTRDEGGKLPMVADKRRMEGNGVADAMTGPSVRALPDAVVAAIFDGSPNLGLVSRPIAAEDGFHLVYVVTRTKESKIPFDTTKGPLIKDLRLLRAREEVEEVVSGLMNTQDVERHPELLDALQ